MNTTTESLVGRNYDEEFRAFGGGYCFRVFENFWKWECVCERVERLEREKRDDGGLELSLSTTHLIGGSDLMRLPSISAFSNRIEGIRKRF